MHIVTKASTAVIPSAIDNVYEDGEQEQVRVDDSEAAAKTASVDSAAISAIAVAQWRTTESGVFARRTVAAPNNTWIPKRMAIAIVTGDTNGGFRRSRHAATMSARSNGATEIASKRCSHSQIVPSPSEGRRRP